MTSIRSLIAAAFLALSFFGGASEARAENPSGHRFCDAGIRDPQDLIQRIQAAPTDTATLRGCRANTRHFIQAYQVHVRTHGINAAVNTKAELVAFLGTFKEVEGASTNYKTDMLWQVNGTYRVRIDAEERSLGDAEKVYGVPDRDGNMVVLLYTACANPGSGEVPIVVTAKRDDCVEVRFPTTVPAQAVRGAYIGPRALEGRCHQLTAAGMSKPFDDYPDECPDRYQAVRGGRTVTIVCDWSDVVANSSRVMGQPVQVQNVSYSFKARATGTNVWRLPRQALEGLPTICWEMPDGTFRTLSVGKDSFVNGVATITVEHMETIRWQQ